MPGITGIIEIKPRENSVRDLQIMVQSMLHETFYNSGTYTNSHLGVYTGWVCHEGSFSDCNPVWNEKKTVVLIFFGENFSDLELFDRLKEKHHKFNKHNSTYIIHLYEEKGITFLKDLNGWFSGLLIDLQEKKIFLFNDRYGLQKIYYHEGRDAFFFSSEAKSLLKICSELREMDNRGLGEWLGCDCVLENRTLFRNIFLLPGASQWEFNNRKIINKKSYFNPDTWENQTWLEKEFFYDKLQNTFIRILPRYFRAMQNIGISLTGGLDTRAILSNINMARNKYPCYTFGGIYRDCHDVKIARKVSDACHQTHQTLYLDRNFLQDFSKYAEKTVYITDGNFGVSGSYEVYLNGLARKIAPIRMTGNYGGEILRGIEGVLKTSTHDKTIFNSCIYSEIKAANDTISNIYKSSKHPMTVNLFKEIPWFRNQCFVIEQSQVTPRTPYLDNDLVALMYRAPPDARHDMELTLRLISNGNPVLGEICSDRGFGGRRSPLWSSLKELLYEFTFKAEYAYNYGMPQWLAALDHKFKFVHMEKLFLGRHKFAHFRLWYRDELASYIKSILLDERTLSRPYFNRNSVEKIVAGHTKGNRNYTTIISKMLSLELIQRLLIEN